MILGRGLNVGCSHPWGVQIRSSCGLYYVRRPSIPSPSDLIHNICQAFQSSWENQGKYARAFLQPINHAYTDRVTGRPRRRRLYRKEQGPGERIFGSQEMPAGLTTHPLTRLSSPTHPHCLLIRSCCAGLYLRRAPLNLFHFGCCCLCAAD